MRNKTKWIIVATFLISLIALNFSGCSTEKKVQMNEFNKAIEFVEKISSFEKDDTTDVLIDTQLKKDDIDHYYQHGDHWHVFTKDGKEHITYKDPSKLEDTSNIEFVSIVSSGVLKNMDVVKILKHEDHYHVVTRDGTEYLTYENPSSLFPNLVVETYVGNHGDNHVHSNFHTQTGNKSNGNLREKIVKILKHGDHYHLYTVTGKEFITYTDPRSLYPDALFDEYVGTHSNQYNDIHHDHEHNDVNDLNDEIENLNVVYILGKDKVDKYDIVTILRHGDHYHIYDSAGREGITYTNPANIYPNAKFDDYVGDHADSDISNSNEIDWPDGVVRIVDHNDHWHLYNANDEEIAVVTVNPKSHYPKAEYIKEDTHNNVVVSDDELFEYADVEAKIVNDVIPFLTKNLLAMDSFGIPDTSKGPVYGTDSKGEVFYWLHGSHYHAISIKQLIQGVKAGAFGENTARDVVSTIKYIVENPGVELNYKADVTHDEVKELLSIHYNVDQYNIQIVENSVTIFGKNLFHLQDFFMSDFTKKDGKVVYKKGELPELHKNPYDNDETVDDSPRPKPPNKYKISEQDIAEKEKREKENLKKLSDILGMEEDDVIDLIVEVIYDQNPIISELIVHDDGTVEFNKKIYRLVKPN